MININDIFIILKRYEFKINKNLIYKAYKFAAKAHNKQLRRSGECYLTHPLEVAKILSQLYFDEITISTGLLHDTIEDSPLTLQNINDEFGPTITYLVDGVTKLTHINFCSYKEKQAENFRKMLIAMSKDIRVLIVKLADRLHNMRTLKYMPNNKKLLIAKETIEIYAPLANRVGISWLKSELEDLSFKHSKYKEYKKLIYIIGLSKKERTLIIQKTVDIITKELKNNSIINFNVSGRLKHIWSIYLKMINKKINSKEIYDIIAFRVIVENIHDCYKVLGCLHSIWHPIFERFKDYIAMPKSNGYQSLHTILIGPIGEKIEVQIRTKNMNVFAESGIASHWRYKELQNPWNNINNTNIKKQKFLWLRQLVHWRNKLKNSDEFIDSVKFDLFLETIYIITPKGDIIELPINSTPIDFAFAIHSNIGLHCIGAKVNGKIISLIYKLHNGDKCYILTHISQFPKKKWLYFIRSSRARDYIKTFIKKIENKNSKNIGLLLLTRELKKYKIKIKLKDEIYALKKYNIINDMILGLGYGKIKIIDAMKVILNNKIYNKYIKMSYLTSQNKNNKIIKTSIYKVNFQIANEIIANYANCCSPIKGEIIKGFIARNKKIIIHKPMCSQIFFLNKKKCINLIWNTDFIFNKPVILKINTSDRQGMLFDITNIFKIMKINILKAKCNVLGKYTINTFICNATGIKHIKNTISMLESIKDVYSVHRIFNIS